MFDREVDVESAVSECLENHYWRDTRNLIGLFSGITWYSVNLVFLPSQHHDAASLSAVEGLLDILESSEAYALSTTPWDASTPENQEDALNRYSAVIAGRRIQGAFPNTKALGLAARELGRTAAAILQDVRPLEPFSVTRSVLRAGITSGLDRKAIYSAARPWRLRDRVPGHRRVLAFEAALTANERPFAYETVFRDVG